MFGAFSSDIAYINSYHVQSGPHSLTASLVLIHVVPHPDCSDKCHTLFPGLKGLAGCYLGRHRGSSALEPHLRLSTLSDKFLMKSPRIYGVQKLGLRGSASTTSGHMPVIG